MMIKGLVAFAICFPLISIGVEKVQSEKKDLAADCVECFNFVAPTVSDAELVSPAEIGLIVYDSQAGTFRGSTSTGWQQVGDTLSVNNSAGNSNITLESGVKSFQKFNPTSSEITVTLGDSFKQGSLLTLKNAGTEKIIVNSDDASSIVAVYPGATLQFVASSDSPTLAADWEVVGSITSDWIEFPLVIDGSTSNPTKGTIDYDKAYWRRVGDSMQIRASYRQTTAGSSGSGNYLIKLPVGYTIDSSKTQMTGGIDQNVVGSGAFGAGEKYGIASAFDTTSILLVGSSPGDAGQVVWGSGVANHNLGGPNVRMSMNVTVPITGWTNSRGI